MVRSDDVSRNSDIHYPPSSASPPHSTSADIHVHEHDLLWDKTKPDLDALDDIVRRFFRFAAERTLIGGGVYARAFCYTLADGRAVVARVILPVRTTAKTEAEVAAMDLIRTRTSLPVPKIYLYSSDPQNPVGAEWILMQFMEGSRLCDCWDKLSHSSRLKTAVDMARVVASFYSIRADVCGTIVRSCGTLDACDNAVLGVQAVRYPLPGRIASSKKPYRPLSSSRSVLHGEFVPDGVSDITLLAYPDQVDVRRCGPFNTELEFLTAFAYRGDPPTRQGRPTETAPYHKIFEIYRDIRPRYRADRISTLNGRFHFAHGDLSDANILVDRETGRITGVIDFEMAGFRPAWLSVVPAGWFDDDDQRCIMVDWQTEVYDYKDDNPADSVVRARFRSELYKVSEEAYAHLWLGVELRGLFYACCNELGGNTAGWIDKYVEEGQWNESRRGPFPFDYHAWLSWYIPNSSGPRDELGAGHDYSRPIR